MGSTSDTEKAPVGLLASLANSDCFTVGVNVCVCGVSDDANTLLARVWCHSNGRFTTCLGVVGRHVVGLVDAQPRGTQLHVLKGWCVCVWSGEPMH